ncbi:radical SAM protein [Solidesulfovibrio carbinolicus]|uniref:Radical SAM protein n=1 Tax=Solidesulfovibrio carbinolicus TaxID=296842 RepID=A0A4P6HQ98_9BACT|nr:radical SAM protein [Solidesulfovibrio carbinolicus]QAZ67388.1 radical SAM protein [Solidesulfovibrio carbinolicus]
MIDKAKIQAVMQYYGKAYVALADVASAWERGERPEDTFFTLKNLPVRVFVEPTNRCNKRCVYCARPNMTRQSASLTLDDFKRAVDGIPAGAYLQCTGNGEPLLNPDTPAMIAHARQKGLLVGIITNGTRLTAKLSRALIEAGPHQVQISFDAVDRDVFNASYNSPKGGCGYEATLSKILRFLDMERREYRKGIFVSIASVLTNAVRPVREKSRAYWERLPVDNYFEAPLLSLQTDSGTAHPARTGEEPWKLCSNPWKAVKVNADGAVNPCVHDFSSKYVIGNIKQQPLREIVNSPAAVALRKALYYQDIDFFKAIGYNCQDCNVWSQATGHDVRGYLDGSFPVTYGLIVSQLAGCASYTPEKMENLRRAASEASGALSGI